MKVTANEDLRTFNIHYESPIEKSQFEISFTKKIRNWKFRTKGKRWKGDVSYLYGSGLNQISIGLWTEIKKVCERFRFPISFHNTNIIFDRTIDADHVYSHYLEILENNPRLAPRPRQPEAVILALKYRYGLLSLSQSIGKTLIIYTFVSYVFKYKGVKKVLIIYPDTDMALQTHDEFCDFKNSHETKCYDFDIRLVYGGVSKKQKEAAEAADIVIGNFQTLSNRPKEFFENFDAIICDEVHRGINDSTKAIIDNCGKTKYRIGLSGSIVVDNTADFYTMMDYYGHILLHVPKKEIIEEGFATNIEIRVYKLKYLQDKTIAKLAGLKYSVKDDIKRLQIEQNLIRNNKTRLDWIVDLILHLNKNMIVYFLDVKYGYGKKIVEELRLRSSTKEVYYVDGDVDDKLRAVYRAKMEEGDNKVLVASYDTWSTGKSINNIWYIVNVESRKSETTISQAFGRGMRLLENKEKCVWIDIVDDFSAVFDDDTRFENFMLKHHNVRTKQYISEGFDIKTMNIDLRDMTE